MQKPHNDNSWVRCKNCGHKLFKIIDEGGMRIETKCHSCKTINNITIKKERGN